VEDIVKKIEVQYGAAGRIWVMDRGMVSQESLEYPNPPPISPAQDFGGLAVLPGPSPRSSLGFPGHGWGDPYGSHLLKAGWGLPAPEKRRCSR